MDSIKINNVEIIFKIRLDIFDRCNLIIKKDNIIKYDINIYDVEMLNSLRKLYLCKDDNLSYSEIIDILNKNIDSNNLL